MCTVSWLPAPGGYTLCFNRDERHTRGPALPPERRAASGRVFLAPFDSDHGGTWLAVNDGGLTLGLLNRYGPGAVVTAGPARSRGLVILELIAAADVAAALRALEHSDLRRTPPFLLVALEPDRPPRIAEWDGAALAMATHHAPGLLRTSSAVTEPEVAAARRAQFAAAAPGTAAELAALHRSHHPDRGKRSVCMHREDAETRSFSQVTVTPDRVTLLHVPDAPCRGLPLPPLTLDRRALPCPTPE